jgi:tungstate transport system substrate-binding protein
MGLPQENDVMRKPPSHRAHRPLPLCLRAVSIVGFGVLAACGRGDDAASSSTQSDSLATPGIKSIILGTTTSTQDSGLLDSLLPSFRAATGIDVKVIAVGTGAALDMARRGNADAVLAHAPASERDYVTSGDLTGGRLVMHNDFLLVGPPDDPARAKGARTVSAAMQAIARTGPFVSRGDGSGTEKMELALWKDAGIDASAVRRRESTGQGMGATLNDADQHDGYTLTDRATYLALKPRLSLVPVFEGDPRLLNIYHAYVVNPVKHPGAKAGDAERFVAFLVSPETQRAIGEFGRARFGKSLFVPDAGKDSTQLGLR